MSYEVHMLNLPKTLSLSMIVLRRSMGQKQRDTSKGEACTASSESWVSTYCVCLGGVLTCDGEYSAVAKLGADGLLD
jgi:hypothetical protein